MIISPGMQNLCIIFILEVVPVSFSAQFDFKEGVNCQMFFLEHIML